MFEILKSMIKEEWRTHSSMFGNFMFAMFPVMLAVFTFIFSLFLPVFETIIPTGQIILIAHYVFVLFGMSIGAFGLLGREVMNRRFGQASLIAYSSRSLPVSERKIFLNFFVKDVIYYFLLWILPFMVGFGIAAPFISISLGSFFLFLLTLSLSFLIGLSLIFFLSTIYAHSSRIFITVLILIAFATIMTAGYFQIDLLNSLPSLSFFFSPSLEKLGLSLILIIVPSALSLVFLKVDYPEKKRRYRNSLEGLSKNLGFSRNSHFISKDFIDLQRSEGGLGKIIFSFIFPVAIIWVLLFMFLKFIPVANFFLLFSILLGVVASSIYEWLSEFDIFTSYLFLPVKVSTLIKSKIIGYVIINLVPLVILVLTAFWTGEFLYFPAALLTFLSVSSYSLAIKIYLTGLYPNILLYNAKIFAQYLLLGVPVMLALIFLSIINPFYLLASPVLIPVSLFIIRRGCVKWDNREQLGF